MEELLDIFFQVLGNLNFSSGFRDIRKKTENPFLRAVLYVTQVAATLLLGAVIAVVLLLLFKIAGLFIA